MSQYNIDRFENDGGGNKVFAYISIVAMALLVYVLFWHRETGVTEAAPVRDTIVIRDTIVMPVAVRDTIVKTVYRTLPTVEVVTRTDTVVVRDSVMVEIPISRKVYEDSAYRATISGYEPILEEMIIKHREVTVQMPKERKKRWNIGPSVGIGFGKDGVTPYVGIGVNYSLYSW